MDQKKSIPYIPVLPPPPEYVIISVIGPPSFKGMCFGHPKRKGNKIRLSKLTRLKHKKKNK